MVVSAKFQQYLGEKIIIPFIHGVSSISNCKLTLTPKVPKCNPSYSKATDVEVDHLRHLTDDTILVQKNSGRFGVN